MGFKIIGLNQNEIDLIKQERKEQRDKAIKPLEGVSGVYILTFPNGKKYIGQSSNIGERLKSHFSILIYSKRRDMYQSRQYIQDKELPWYTLCKQENPNLQVKDIQIYWEAAQYPKERETELLKSISVEDRCKYYNSQWF